MARRRTGVIGGIEGIRVPPLKGPEGVKAPPGFGRRRYGTRGASLLRQVKSGVIPGWWGKRYPDGTLPEFAVYVALMRLGFREGKDFVYRPRPDIDFLLPDKSLVILIRRKTERPTTVSPVAPDTIRDRILTSQGFVVVHLEEDDIINDPIAAVRDALGGRGTREAVRLRP